MAVADYIRDALTPLTPMQRMAWLEEAQERLRVRHNTLSSAAADPENPYTQAEFDVWFDTKFIRASRFIGEAKGVVRAQLAARTDFNPDLGELES